MYSEVFFYFVQLLKRCKHDLIIGTITHTSSSNTKFAPLLNFMAHNDDINR
jgi:hypothetical protein